MSLHAADPIYLWLLVAIPLFWMAGRRLRSIEPGRRWTILVIRTIVLLLLVFALARLELTQKSRDLTVYFLLDQSDSVPSEMRTRATELMRELIDRDRKAEDEAGLIVFGEDASLDTLADRSFLFTDPITSIVEGTRSDISSAIRLALSAFPNNRMKRIILVSDGNENSGSAIEAARVASNNQVPIDVLTLQYDQRRDVQIDKLIVPQQISRDAPFDLKVFLSAEEETGGRLRIYEDGQLIIDQDVNVSEGKNPPLVLPRRLNEGAFHRYRATIEVPGDARPQNNQAESFTSLLTEPKVLYVEGDTVNTNYLAAALELEDIQVDIVTTDGIPYGLEELQSYDSLILSNVHASSMTRDQMKMIERAVHDLGLGLIMIGGEDSFGAGGYTDTPIEEALPVSMDVKQKKILPNGALVVVLHTCEIAAGNSWARKISLAALDVLSAEDYFGLLYFGSSPGAGVGGGMGGWGNNWLWSPGLQKTGTKRAMRAQIRGVAPGDMPDFISTLRMAHTELNKVKTQAKHIVIISDGDASPPSQAEVEGIRDDGISISTVTIGPHSGGFVSTMRNIAYWGGGNDYYPTSPNQLPRIFIKEASLVRRSLIFEEPFFPVWSMPSEALEGFVEFPQLLGYVVTSDKPESTIALRSDKDDPLLAHWRHGLGKTVAFTSDAKSKWATNWVDWDSYSKFWSQIVRWSLRETSSSNLQVNTEMRDGKGIVTIDAVDMEGRFRNHLDFDAVVLSPEMEPTPLRVTQVAPGRYEGSFDASEVGTYMIRLRTEDEGYAESVVAGAALSYSPEYQASRSNEEFMAKIARESKGVEILASTDYSPFERNLPMTSRPKPIWPWLLLAGLILVPADVFVRRVYWSFKDVWGAISSRAVTLWLILTFQQKRQETRRSEAMGSLLAAKDRALASRKMEKEEEEARREFRERMEQQERGGPGAPDRSDRSVFDDAKESGGKQPVRRGSKQTVSASDGGGEQPSTMGGLLEAKKRARKKM